MSNIKRYNGTSWEAMTIDADSVGGFGIRDLATMDDLSDAMNEVGADFPAIHVIDPTADGNTDFNSTSNSVQLLCRTGTSSSKSYTFTDINGGSFSTSSLKVGDLIMTTEPKVNDWVYVGIFREAMDSGYMYCYTFYRIGVDTNTDTNYYPIRKFTTGLQLATGRGSDDCALYAPKADSSQLGVVKLGYSTSGKNYKVQADSSGNLYVNVPWEASSSSTTYGNASATVLGLIRAYCLTTSRSTSYGESAYAYENAINIQLNSNYVLYIRSGKFKQQSGSGTTARFRSFLHKMAVISSSNMSSISQTSTSSTSSSSSGTYSAGNNVHVILGDSSGQSTSGGYMGSLAVDSADATGFSYRASNGELGYVFYIAIGLY